MNTIEKVIQDPVCIGGYLIHPKKMDHPIGNGHRATLDADL